MGYVKGLVCKECKRAFPKEPSHVCEFCFGPLEVNYDYEAIKKVVTKKSIESGPPSMWRYEALLPLDEPPKVGFHTGFPSLVRAKNLGKALGVNNLYIKNDSVNHPTFSFKDRVVAVAVSKAIEFGFDTVACPSTGNLANSLAAHAAEAGLKSVIFIPDNLEAGKILGTLVYGAQLISIKGSYDDINRLCSEIGNNRNWAFVNINIRPYYGDGSKSYGGTYIQTQKYDEAELLLKESLEYYSDFHTTLNNLGEIYFISEQYDLAKKYLEKATRINPFNPFTHVRLIELYEVYHRSTLNYLQIWI